MALKIASAPGDTLPLYIDANLRLNSLENIVKENKAKFLLKTKFEM